MKRIAVLWAVAVGGCSEDAPLLEVRPALAVGTTHACVIDDDDALRCWGDPTWPTPLEWEGVDGLDYAVPALDVPGGVADVAVGEGWICALSRRGVIACWGVKEYELEFLARDRVRDAIVADVGEPFVDVAVGWAHVCGATASGDVWCWGENGSGALGQGHTDEIDDGAIIAAIELPSPAVEVAAAGRRSCARTEDADVYCWGGGEPLPTRVVLDDDAAQISVGSQHACAVGESGSLACWGAPTSALPTVIAFESPVVQMSAGATHDCARLQNGEVRCWGSNTQGQLGLGRVLERLDDPRAEPPIDVGGLVTSVAAATSPRTCARLDDGQVRCWGRTERWDGTRDADCMLEVPNPNAELVCEPATIEEFSCAAGMTCCIGDDETPASAVAVPI